LTDKRVHDSKVFKGMMEGIERRGEKVGVGKEGKVR